MKNQENIDQFFAKQLQQYERQPSAAAWSKLEGRLAKQESKVIPLWWKFASAASVALLLASGVYWMNSSKDLDATKIASIKPGILTGKATKSKVEELASATKKETISVVIAQKPLESSNIITQNGIVNHGKAIKKATGDKNIINVKEEDVLPKNIPSPQIPKSLPISEPNTIVLVVENTPKTKVPEKETIVLNLIETQMDAVTEATPLDESTNRKQSKFNRIWQQLKKAKNGENVDWKEVGFKPQKLLARADAKIENALTNGEETEK